VDLFDEVDPKFPEDYPVVMIQANVEEDYAVEDCGDE
jgi:hypothetical protein